MIARWIARLFSERSWDVSPNLAIQGAGWWHDMDGGSDPSAKRVRILVPVCASCYSGWMSELERRVTPILSKLMFAEPASAGDAETDLLAAWSFKTLVNASFEAHRRASALVSTTARDHLRQRLLPPQEVSLVAFRVDGLDTMIQTRTKDVAIRTPGGRSLDTAIVCDCAHRPICRPDGVAS